MHAAKLESSGRLQRVLAVLKGGEPKTTRELIRAADVCAVNSAVSELRRNGLSISCRPIKRGVYEYRLEGDEV